MSGSGTAAGTSFQARVAARYAVYALMKQVPTGVALVDSGGVPTRVWCEAPAEVDDVVVDTVSGGVLHVQAKTNVTASVTAKSDLAKTVNQFVRQCRARRDDPTKRALDPTHDRLILAAGSKGGNRVRIVLRDLLNRARDLGIRPADAAPSVAEQKVLKVLVDHVDRCWLDQSGSPITESERDATLALITIDAADLRDGEHGEREAIRDLATGVLVDGDSGAGAWGTLCHRFHSAASQRSGGRPGTFISWLQKAGHAVDSRRQHSAEFVTTASFYEPLDDPHRLLRHDLP